MQRACSPGCALQLVSAQKAKVARKMLKDGRERLKSRTKWLAEAQQAVNAWVRWRDRDLPCISCGAEQAKQWHAGHYLSRGARPDLRFDLANIHKQCSQCNDHLSGNIARYRPALIAKIGADEVARLEGPPSPKRMTVEQIKALRDEFRARLRNNK